MPIPADQKPTNPQKPGSDTGPGDTRPYLCIPYWEVPRFSGDSVDIGQSRPLPSGPPPAGVISWECPGIHASPYSPGSELQVVVDVRNSGGGSATVVATVVVYWADPTVGFAKPNFFGAATVAAPTLRDPSVPGFVSATLSAVIPAGAPDHICLLACVTHSLDLAGTAPDPINDRHWAQHNLIAVSPKIFPVIVPFIAANPFAAEHVFALRVHPLDRRSLEALALRMNLEPGEGRIRLRLMDSLGKTLSDQSHDVPVPVALGPHGRHRYAVRLEVEPRPSPHQVIAVEVSLYRGTDQQRPVGSLGILIQGAQ
jgi:hypothetical protein